MAWVVEIIIQPRISSKNQRNLHYGILNNPDKHSMFFNIFPLTLLLDRVFKHVIEIEEGIKLVRNTPYLH